MSTPAVALFRAPNTSLSNFPGPKTLPLLPSIGRTNLRIETPVTSHCVFPGRFPSRLIRESVRFELFTHGRCDSLPGGRLSASKSDCHSLLRVASRFCVGYHLRQPMAPLGGFGARPWCKNVTPQHTNGKSEHSHAEHFGGSRRHRGSRIG